MDFRNEYRIVPSEYRGCPYQLEYRNWWSPWRWRYISILCSEDEAVSRAKTHAELHAGIGTKYLGRLP